MNIHPRSSLISLAIAALMVGGCGGGDGDRITEGGSLYSTAPAQATLDVGKSVEYRINGGKFPYTVTSGNTSVATAEVSAGKLTITAVSPGSASVTITDAAGQRQTFMVTVAPSAVPQQQAGVPQMTPLALSPTALTVGNCTTRIPFIFTGGRPPYRILTSDNFQAPVSSALKLDDTRWYFFADMTYGALSAPGDTVVLTVLDADTRVTTSTVKVDIKQGCPAPRPLLVVTPEAAHFRTDETLSFAVEGGDGWDGSITSVSFAPSVSLTGEPIADVAVVDLPHSTATTIAVRALRPGTTLMTVISRDQQRASVVIQVLPQP